MNCGPASSRYGHDGHAVPLVGVWHAGGFAFCTGAEEQKHRNLDENPQVAVTTGNTGANGWNSGKDVVVEGTPGGAHVFRVEPAKVTAFGDAHGQTTYRL
jgi:hypothetical protein